jgi:hypothetical protein
MLRKKVLALCLGTCVAFGLSELGLRWLLFSKSELAERWGAAIRQPHKWAHPETDAYWYLQHHFLGSAAGEAHGPDPEIGWVAAINPITGEHPDEPTLGLRRPVLLFGDSFAQCTTPPEECFQTLLASSDLGADHALLNYGVGGYGLDQIYLLIRRVLPRFGERNPKVIVGVMIDDDYLRSSLSFRCWPKSSARIESGRLVVDPAGTCDVAEWSRLHPLPLRSWAIQMVQSLRGHQIAEETRPSLSGYIELNRRLLEAIDEELRNAKVEYSFLFFSAQGTLTDDSRVQWTMELSEAFARESNAPAVFTKPYFLAAAGDPAGIGDLFGQTGRDLGHYNPAGNKVAFEALRQAVLDPRAKPGLERVLAMRNRGELRSAMLQRRKLPVLPCESVLTTRTNRALARQVLHSQPDGKRLLLGAHCSGLTEWRLELEGRFRQLTARIRSTASVNEVTAPVPVMLDVLIGERRLNGFPLRVEPGLTEQAFQIPLQQAGYATICLSVPEGLEEGWVEFLDLRLD